MSLQHSRRSTLASAVLALLLLLQSYPTRAQEAAQPEAPTATPAPPPLAQPQSAAPNSGAAQISGGAQGNQRQANQRRADPQTPAAPASGPTDTRRLPPDSTTRQVLNLPGRTLTFNATAGSIRLFDDKNEPEADIVFTAYQLEGADPHTRPVAFIFNGGPGSASAWLQFGNAGPWRLAMSGDALSPSAAPALMPNAETWLDFTDLVFIDPVGTGYSRFVSANDDVRKRYFSVEGDARSIALMIRRWLEKSNRLLSPKYVVGESYGGIRGPKVVHDLEVREGVGIKGLILISPVLDFREFSGTSLLHYVANLPTMTAVAREAKAPVSRLDMADVEHYAATDFLTDLVKGEADVEATKRIVDKVAGFTTLDPTLVSRLAGRIEATEFRREFDRRDGRVAGRYDASVSGLDPYPDSSFYHFDDPSSDPLVAPMTSAVVDLTREKLNWRPDGSYVLLSETANRAWDWGHGINPPESLDQLRQILAGDPQVKLLVAQGLFDLALPYFGTKIELDQLPTYGAPGRIKFVVFPGGHMFYSRDASRKAFREEAEAVFK